MSDYDYDFVGYDDGDSNYHESWVLATGNPKSIYEFVKHFKKDGDISALENRLVQFRNVRYSLLFLKDIKGADINKHFDILVESENFKICFWIYKNYYQKLDSYQRNLLTFIMKATVKTENEYLMLAKIENINKCSEVEKNK